MDYGYSEILDWPYPMSGTKPVDHQHRKMHRVQLDSYDETVWNQSTGKPIQEYQCQGPEAHCYSWGDYGEISHSNIVASYATDVPSLLQQAKHRFMNENQVENLVNIVESEQFVGSLKQLHDLTSRSKSSIVAALGPTTGSLKKQLRGIKLRSLDLSNLYLMWQFGFAPLISDLQKCAKSVRTIKSSLNAAISRAGKPYSVVVSSPGTLSVGNMGGMTGYGPISHAGQDSSWWHEQLTLLEQPIRRVGVKGIRTYDYNSSTFQKVDYYLSRFAANGPASYIWERIPFSFVVDWFVDLSAIIDNLDDALAGGNKSITDCWTSEQWRVLASAVKHRTIAWTSDSDGSPTVNNELGYYHREPLPDTSRISLSGRFGKKQSLLLAALLH